MWFRSLFNARKSRSRRQPSVTTRLWTEPLEDRRLLSNYFVTDLGLEFAGDLNNHGQVVGQKRYVQGDHAALWQNGTLTDLGSLGTSGVFSEAWAVSDAGHVAGYSFLSNDSTERHAILVTPEDTNQDGLPDRWFRDNDHNGINDLMTDLGTLGGAESFAYDVNSSGQVVGKTLGAGPSLDHAFLWHRGVMTDLGIPAGPDSQARRITDAGQVYGTSGFGGFLINPEDTDADGAPDRWFRDTNGDNVNDLMIPLPLSPGDINATGQVVGGQFLWTPDTPNAATGTLIDLGANSGATGSLGLGLNASGDVVGRQGFGDEASWAEVATLWEDGVAVDLNTRIPAGPTGYPPYLAGANAINDLGWILAGSALLLTPADQSPPPVLPKISIGDATVTEGNSGTRAASFSVTLSKSSTEAVTVYFTTMNGIATPGIDYQATSGTLTFAPGETSQTITVPVYGDRLGEGHEDFGVFLSGANNALIADGMGDGLIVDDEPRISISDVTKAEGRRGQTTLFTFTVTLSAAYDQPVTMSFRTANGTARTSDSDYVAKTGTLTFAPGETTKTITIDVKGDSKREADETFYLDLFGNSSNSLFTNTRGIGTILNDD